MHLVSVAFSKCLRNIHMHVMGTGYILHVIYLQLHAVETRGHKALRKDDLVTMHYSRLRLTNLARISRDSLFS